MHAQAGRAQRLGKWRALPCATSEQDMGIGRHGANRERRKRLGIAIGAPHGAESGFARARGGRVAHGKQRHLMQAGRQGGQCVAARDQHGIAARRPPPPPLRYGAHPCAQPQEAELPDPRGRRHRVGHGAGDQDAHGAHHGWRAVSRSRMAAATAWPSGTAARPEIVPRRSASLRCWIIFHAPSTRLTRNRTPTIARLMPAM